MVNELTTKVLLFTVSEKDTTILPTFKSKSKPVRVGGITSGAGGPDSRRALPGR